ncbi:hypothetical protein SAMN05444266_102638 [Chitinophaga jiangningensis]|uniref:Uncharacterized protein n=1 Tax=Chitinophaga jiangningensis TaxID=1419482 RepID=A0A1M6Z727_9BACT|nr:hypothetical protein SAMN05444266_102638 [Chitinophaga jiangningensis]
MNILGIADTVPYEVQHFPVLVHPYPVRINSKYDGTG